MSGNAGGISTNATETLPLAMSARPGTAPLYGMWRISVPVMVLNCSAKI
jgi:hypothetical protein